MAIRSKPNPRELSDQNLPGVCHVSNGSFQKFRYKIHVDSPIMWTIRSKSGFANWLPRTQHTSHETISI
jgi:hypothetical protein